MAYWIGADPTNCDLCSKKIGGETFVDGKTSMGPWACMCLACHQEQGGNLGMGRGQAYKFQRSGEHQGKWLKVGG